MIDDQETSHWTLAPEGTEVHATAEAWKLLSHGDHIVVMVGGWRHGYAHHGIVLRESRLDQDPDIAHFTSPSGDRRMRDARLQIDTYINFLARHTTYGIVQYTSPTDFADEIVHRKRAANIAKLMVETPSMALRKYDLIHWNCECFAWICKTGGLKHNSDQVYRVLRDICDDIQKGDKSFLLRTASSICAGTKKEDSFKEESNASEEPMTATVEAYDALLLELENCRIKNQTLIKYNDELKLIFETTRHENILLKNQLVPELSPYHFGHDLLTSLNMPFCNTKCCILLLDSSGARQCKKNRQATGLLCTTHASSPKHVAEKVNKAYATRCVERHAKAISAYQTQSECMQRQKRALLVSPSYATPGLDIRTRYVMEKAGVLPSDLGKYSTEGFARDAAVLRRQTVIYLYPSQDYYHKMKRALLVSPSYALNLEARLTRVLEEAALLPRDLRTYSTTGFAMDVERFKESLGEGFSCNVLGGTSEVPKRDLRAAIQHLLQPGTDVAVLLFCGHGTWSGSTQHGALVCSFGQQITAQEIEDIVAQQGFTGTFVRVLNMCMEEGYPSNNEAPSLTFYESRAKAKGEWEYSQQHAYSSIAEASIPYSIADYNGVIIAASTMFGMARGGAGGSEFMDAWVAVGQLTTYHKLGTVLKEHCPNVRVTMQNMNSKDGVFGHPAKEVPLDAAMKNRSK
eukprot:gene32846-biopygen6889